MANGTFVVKADYLETIRYRFRDNWMGVLPSFRWLKYSYAGSFAAKRYFLLQLADNRSVVKASSFQRFSKLSKHAKKTQEQCTWKTRQPKNFGLGRCKNPCQQKMAKTSAFHHHLADNLGSKQAGWQTWIWPVEGTVGYPIIYRVVYIPGGWDRDFFHQLYEDSVYPKPLTGCTLTQRATTEGRFFVLPPSKGAPSGWRKGKKAMRNRWAMFGSLQSWL